MPDMSPEELDKLFQESSEQMEFEYNAEAWSKMEALLEKDDRRRRLIWWWLGGFIALVVISYLFIRINDDHYDTQSDSRFVEEEKTSINKKEEDLIYPKNSLKPRANFDSQKNKKNPSAKENKQSKAKQRSMDKRPIASFENKLESLSLPLSNTEKKEKVNISNKRAISYLPHIMMKLDWTNSMPALIAPKTFGSTPIKKNLDGYVADALLFGIVLAEEFSSVKAQNLTMPNWKVGLQIEYRFRHRLSTGIGAYYIRKHYEASEGDYTPPLGFWTRMIAPQATSARTEILEIPISFGYFPNGYAHKGFYTNIGLTSFFMLKERYHYSYNLPDTDLIREWGTQNENRHWFGMGHISAGYYYFLSNKLDVQFGPYLQIPITGIGHGQVKVWSFGANLKLNFKMY